MNEEAGKIIKRILRDIQVELGDEFDRNFERQAFFSEAWARRKSPNRPGGTLLIDTGNLRRSVRSRTTENSITFFTDLPYASIHNDGGEIVVTAGERRNDKRTQQLSTEADFWRFMAIKRAGTTIRIPRRRFLGAGPEVERIVREIIEENLNEYFNVDFSIERK